MPAFPTAGSDGGCAPARCIYENEDGEGPRPSARQGRARRRKRDQILQKQQHQVPLQQLLTLGGAHQNDHVIKLRGKTPWVCLMLRIHRTSIGGWGGLVQVKQLNCTYGAWMERWGQDLAKGSSSVPGPGSHPRLRFLPFSLWDSYPRSGGFAGEPPAPTSTAEIGLVSILQPRARSFRAD